MHSRESHWFRAQRWWKTQQKVPSWSGSCLTSKQTISSILAFKSWPGVKLKSGLSSSRVWVTFTVDDIIIDDIIMILLKNVGHIYNNHFGDEKIFLILLITQGCFTIDDKILSLIIDHSRWEEESWVLYHRAPRPACQAGRKRQVQPGDHDDDDDNHNDDYNYNDDIDDCVWIIFAFFAPRCVDKCQEMSRCAKMLAFPCAFSILFAVGLHDFW